MSEITHPIGGVEARPFPRRYRRLKVSESEEEAANDMAMMISKEHVFISHATTTDEAMPVPLYYYYQHTHTHTELE